MKALIYKDLVAVKKYFRLFTLAILAMIFYSFKEGQILIILGLFILVPIALTSTFFDVDLKSNINQYLIGLGIDRKRIVLSRYAITWIFGIFAMLIVLIFNIKYPDSKEIFNLPLILSLTLFLTNFACLIQLPFMYKYGSQKSRMVFTLIYFLIFLGVNQIWKNNQIAIDFINKVSNFNLNLLSIIIVGITVLLNMVSLKLSIHFYKNKDFWYYKSKSRRNFKSKMVPNLGPFLLAYNILLIWPIIFFS